MKAIAAVVTFALGWAAPAFAAEDKIAVVAAENFYGDVARQIGGDRVTVVSIMNSPDQDPHLFETTPTTVRQIATAQIVILNGANYDPWMEAARGNAETQPHRDQCRATPGRKPSVIHLSTTRDHASGGNRNRGCTQQSGRRPRARLRGATQRTLASLERITACCTVKD
jgi:ABC-type Zn uptake system ZnuABC Zn-binding protein ZnuA